VSHYPPYPEYKTSKSEWISSIPAHWHLFRFKRLATIRNGRDYKDVASLDGAYPVIGSGGPFARASSFLYDGKSVLLGRKGTIDRPLYFDGPFWVVDTMFYTEINADAHPRYVYYSALNIPFSYYSTNTALPSMTQEALSNHWTAAPSRNEQAQIASALDSEISRIDALIYKKTRFIELLREKRQALITSAVTKGLDRAAKLADSGIAWLGAIPAHWTLPKLRHIATVQAGVAKGKNNGQRSVVSVPYLRVANVQDGYLDLSSVTSIDIAVEELSGYLLKPGDVLMNEGGDNDKLGRGHVWNGEIPNCVHQNHVFAVRPTGVTSEWLNLYTQSAPAQFFFTSRSKQTTNLASISSSNLLDLPVPRPDPEEQKEIIRKVRAAESRLSALRVATERSVTLLTERRAAFITAAVTGQIDLRSAA
jgi:type I restriction enzyme S subunit